MVFWYIIEISMIKNKGKFMNKEIKKKAKVIIICIVFIIVICGLINPLTISQYTITDESIPEEFDGYTIVQISDLHDKSFGKDEKKLINKIKECEPDLILLTGDMIDSTCNDIDNITHLVKGLYDICPIYQVDGNHEKDDMVLFSQLCDMYKEYGVIDLNDNNAYITKGKSSLYLNGISMSTYPGDDNTLLPPTDTYSILLYHNAAAFEVTSQLNYNLVLSGHTHGGIIRLPLVGGLISPDITLGAKYESGYYKIGNSTLISNRGLGDSVIPRFYNTREIVSITLKKGN